MLCSDCNSVSQLIQISRAGPPVARAWDWAGSELSRELSAVKRGHKQR